MKFQQSTKQSHPGLWQSNSGITQSSQGVAADTSVTQALAAAADCIADSPPVGGRSHGGDVGEKLWMYEWPA